MGDAMKVRERMADAFKAESTTRVFGMTGDGNMYWMPAFERGARERIRGGDTFMTREASAL